MILVTGSAGFIGYHVAERLLADGHDVVGVDSVNDYYDPKLKWQRLERLDRHPKHTFHRLDVADDEALEAVFAEAKPDVVVHLAAQAGVRFSLTEPKPYVRTNVAGFLNILECCRHHGVKHHVFASSSSVYGANEQMPFSEHHGVGHPISLYAATKRAGELMAFAYAHMHGVPCTGLRFFTVYGPWGRPDMALFKFARAILAGEPIDVYNHGRMERDFTYIDDIVEAIVRVIDRVPEPSTDWNGEAPDPGTGPAPFRVLNVGRGNPVPLMDMIGALERCLGREATKHMLPMQPGDASRNHADVAQLEAVTGFVPATPVDVGVARFVAWYLEHYGADGETP